MSHDPTLRVVRAAPDEEPVEPVSRAVMARWPWLTDEFMRELEEQ
ncbi:MULTISPECIES: hypothetical protein [unclassified Streptomyces]|nr:MULTISPECIES: hypothetical protein [unclassified Streptomyces]